ncbi:hypothetical protein ACIPLC_07320 [Kitasatospora sp. NPDC086801]|uniref:hypothetical protein n=1 Tax=Kitasatospora sp. NPDC086801 TaxID=3364066 RepID=UPI0037FA8011
MRAASEVVLPHGGVDVAIAVVIELANPVVVVTGHDDDRQDGLGQVCGRQFAGDVGDRDKSLEPVEALHTRQSEPPRPGRPVRFPVQALRTEDDGADQPELLRPFAQQSREGPVLRAVRQVAPSASEHDGRIRHGGQARQLGRADLGEPPVAERRGMKRPEDMAVGNPAGLCRQRESSPSTERCGIVVHGRFNVVAAAGLRRTVPLCGRVSIKPAAASWPQAAVDDKAADRLAG